METPAPGTPARPALAFLYDRHATLATAALDERITRCRRYAVERGWVVAGEWVDRGDAALTNWPRPRWEAMTYAMRQAAARPLCLVDSWDRISRDREGSAILRLAVHQAGGYCMTTGGENDLELGRGRITVTAPLPRRARP
ncbi:recombinase family protein [Streptomyces sp. NPDC004134]|uniref:recombinase family protein n=1 Tax=Streptomyces sp. NPDC004134 TaxID=3364691 RepID=UPI0036781DD6